VCRHVCCRAQMRKVMVTVLRHNTAAQEFFLNKLKYVHSVGRPLKSPLHNQLPSRYHSHKAMSLEILVRKLVAMATALRHLISAMSSSDSLTPKTHPVESNSVSLTIIQPKIIAHQKPVIANCIPKLVAVATSLSSSGPPSNT